MKKILLVLLVLMVTQTTIGQNKWQQKQINYFVEEATKEYDLNKSQVKDLKKARLEMVTGYSNLSKISKEGKISDEEKKEKGKVIGQDFQKKMIEITGKTYKEITPFFKRMRIELKNLK